MNSRKPSITSLIAFGFVLGLAYFLSFGPVFVLAFAGHVPDDTFSTLGTVYTPVVWLIERVDWIGEFYQRYIWWLFDLLGA